MQSTSPVGFTVIENDEQLNEACLQYSHLASYVTALERMIVAYAKQDPRGGFSYGGEEVNGKQVGAFHVYRQQTVFRQVPNPEFVADWYIEKADPEMIGWLLKDLLEKMRVDWYMSFIRKRQEYDQIREYLDSIDSDCPGQAWLGTDEEPVLGEPSISIRVNPPDSNVRIVQPEEK